jgi:hypothetical protein
MRGWLWAGVVGVGCAALVGCAGQFASVTPAEAVARLRTGQPLLRCRESCLAAWQRTEPQAVQLAAAARWQELAVLVLRVGYQDDLTLYYLGRAAEGIGYPGAAASYYRQSMELSGTSISCRYLSRVCGGVALPREASLRLARIDRELSRRFRRRAPPRPAASPSETMPAASEVAEPAPAGAEPFPAPPPPPPPPPAPSPVPPHGSDYIEPPPIVR